MATSKAQRVGIIVIAAVMAVGTIGSFFIIIVANNNQQIDNKKAQDDYNKQLKEYQQQVADAQKKQDEEAKTLSAKYFSLFQPYSSIPAAFDASKVAALEKNDLKVGDGTEIKADTPYRAYYIGWNSDGKVFDGSIDGEQLKAPLEGGTTLIQGWQKGVIGMKMNGVRQISIPGNLAYTENSPSADIKQNAPLKFVIMVIPPASDTK